MTQQRYEAQAVEAAQAQEGAADGHPRKEQRVVLEDIARAMVLPYRDVVRAKTILMLADGVSQAGVARRVGLRRRFESGQSVSWIEDFAVSKMHVEAGPAFFPDRGDAARQVGLPEDEGRSLPTWTCADLARMRPRSCRRHDLGFVGPSDPRFGAGQALAGTSLAPFEGPSRRTFPRDRPQHLRLVRRKQSSAAAVEQARCGRARIRSQGRAQPVAAFDTRTGRVVGILRRRERQIELVELLEVIERPRALR